MDFLRFKRQLGKREETEALSDSKEIPGRGIDEFGEVATKRITHEKRCLGVTRTIWIRRIWGWSCASGNRYKEFLGNVL